MEKIHRVLPILSLLVLFPAFCAAQAPVRESTASISGRVTVGGKGVAGITIVAAMTGPVFGNKTVAKTATDEDGNYQLTGLPAGRITILTIAKAFVAENRNVHRQSGQAINVSSGESITKIDFALIRGGVITGRITDAQGNPLIAERVSIVPKETAGGIRQITISEGPGNMTDDRGIYRAYGLAPGSYTVSVGQAGTGDGRANVMMMGRGQYAITFYPGVSEASKATIIEVKEGAEITGIDITPGKSAEGFSVAGRVVDAESGQPVPDAFIGYSPFTDATQQMQEMNFSGSKTDANGKFRLEGIRPGRYAAFTVGFGPETPTYSDLAPFDISSGDVTGIEIKVRRGGTIDGVAVIENNADPAVSAMLKTLRLFASIEAKGAGAPAFRSSQINADGSFRFVGLSPGKARIGIHGYPPTKALTLIRTELDGMDVQDGIEVAAGARISGVRLVLAYGAGSIRGEVKVEGGVLPEGTTFWLSTQNTTGETTRSDPHVYIDERGRFVGESFPIGTYELTLHAITADRSHAPAFKPLKQTVTVEHGVEARVIFVIDLSAKKAGSQ